VKRFSIQLALLLWCATAFAADKPNILFLFNDDQRADTIAALGNPVIRTPNLDQVNKTQLFDLRNDPFERYDLAAGGESNSKVRGLTARLAKALKQYGDKGALTVPNPRPAAWSPPAEKSPKP